MPGPQVEFKDAIQALQDFNKNVATQLMIRMVHSAQYVRRPEWPRLAHSAHSHHVELE
jgi:hypothetical protein